MRNNISIVSRNLRKRRISKGISQAKLAEMAGVSTNYILRLEAGDRFPSLETFIAIINALDVSADLVLADVISAGYKIKGSILLDRMANLSTENRIKILNTINSMLTDMENKASSDTD